LEGFTLPNWGEKAHFFFYGYGIHRTLMVPGGRVLYSL